MSTNLSKTLNTGEQITDKSNGKKISNIGFGSFFSTLFAPITLLTVPTVQRFNYWINMKLRKDYDTYRYTHEYVTPLVLSPISSLSSWTYQPVLFFDNVDENEFKSDIQKDTQVIISNHVGYADFIIAIQIAIYYGVESQFIKKK